MKDKARDALKTRLLKVRTHLLLDAPFFGTLAMRLKLIEDPTCRTMWVDGVHLGYNPKYVESITDEELKGLLCHEVLHVANGHCWRRGKRDAKDWNKACDYAINPIVLEAGHLLPEGLLVREEFRGKSAEQIYELIHQSRLVAPGPASCSAGNQEEDSLVGSAAAGQGDEGDSADGSEQGDFSEDAQDSKGKDAGFDPHGSPNDDTSDTQGSSSDVGGSGPGESGQEDDAPAPGEVRDAPKDTNPRELEQEWKRAVEHAVIAARRVGRFPSKLQRLVKEVLKPTVDWRDVMHQFIQQSWHHADYSWKRPSPRYLAHGLYLPSLQNETLPCVVVLIDTSASIYRSMLAAFQAEVRAMIEEVKPEETYIVYCDAAVQRVDRFEAGEPVEFHPVGGGGTDFRPFFEWIEKEGITPTCVVGLTDLAAIFPEEEPPYPVLWVSPPVWTEAPWGDHVEMRI